MKMATKYVKEDGPLTDVHKRTLQKCQYDIVPNLEVRDIIAVCHRDEILTSSMIEEVEAKETGSGRCRAFLQKLEAPSIKAFNSFVDALKEHYDFLATMIKMRLSEEALVQASINLDLAYDIAPIDIETLVPEEFEHTRAILKKIGVMTKHLMVRYNVESEAINEDKEDLNLTKITEGLKINTKSQANQMPPPSIHQIQFSPDREGGASASMDMTLLLGAPKQWIERFPVSSSQIISSVNRSILDVPRIREKSTNRSALPYIRSIAELSNGEHVTCGTDAGYSHKALLYDDQWNAEQILVADKAMCVAPNADIVTASCQTSGRVMLFDIKGVNTRDKINKTLPTIADPVAIAFNQQQELVIANGDKKTISHVNITTGKVVDTTPCGMFKLSYSIAVTNQNNILIADWGDESVKTINRQGDLLACYKGDGDYTLKSPRSVCVDSAGNIIIADYGKHHIQLLSPEGNFKKILMNQSDGLENPTAVAINRQGDILIGTLSRLHEVTYMA
ncbi:unnamed protein product [Owenia fusiformis]|uniref:Uncharacterized protein n=1 Tax=Owenia fusiformis TaxID=6347 RepID=A0A8J1U3E0_OWEFU|nr:unnamed protein product [Owenia fusiformis]